MRRVEDRKKIMVARVRNTHRGALFFKKALILSLVALSIANTLLSTSSWSLAEANGIHK